MASEIHWQTGTPIIIGAEYIITDKHSRIGTDFWSGKQWLYHNNEDVLAWCLLVDIEPYVEPKFKIGEFIVENGIIGIVTAINDNGSYCVIGAALMPMTFTPNMCRLATSDEALSISAKLREREMYYDIETNKIKQV